jgi:hypothetical protein
LPFKEPKNILESHKNEQHEPITEEEHDECEDDMELSHDGPEVKAKLRNCFITTSYL